MSNQYVKFPKVVSFPDKLTANKVLKTVSTIDKLIFHTYLYLRLQNSISD